MPREPLLMPGIDWQIVVLWEAMPTPEWLATAPGQYHARRGNFVLDGEVEFFGPFDGEESCRQWCQQKNADPTCFSRC